MTNAEKLKNRYSYLETLIKNKYPSDYKPGWAQKISDKYLPYELRDDLLAINQMRNVITHNTLDNGEEMFEPSNGIINQLEKIISIIEKPILLKDICISKKELLWANEKDSVRKIMEVMNLRGFSNVPVLNNNGLIVGVFNTDIVFKIVSDNKLNILSNEITFDSFIIKPYIDFHSNQRFRLLGQNDTIYDAEKIFADSIKYRVGMILITKTGKIDSPLIGVLTPSHLLKR